MDQDNGKKWELPEPIFRKSTGELVKPSEDVYPDPEPDTLPPNSADDPDIDVVPEPPAGPAAAEPAAPAVPATPETDDPLARLYDPPVKAEGEPAKAPATPAADVEPQPFISEQFSAEKIVVAKDVLQSNGTSRSAWIVIGILILLAAAAAAAALIYFTFFAARANTSGF
ncbi:MAG: hypothetical protein ABJA02_14490 [Acidobacteriota bacterium]